MLSFLRVGQYKIKMENVDTKNKDRAAFACCDEVNYLQEGLTKREYYAGQAMAAMIANPNILRPQENDKKESDLLKFSAIAVEYADALLSALENEA